MSNIKRLEKRREIDARQYREDSKQLRTKQAILERDEQKLERYEKQELREQKGGEYEKARKTREKIEQVRAKIEKSKKDVEGLKDKQARSLEKLWLSNKNYSDAALMINAYESAGFRPLWDINRSFSSRGTFSAEEARGMDTVTMIAEFKQQTELLSSIDENISSMATGDWI